MVNQHGTLDIKPDYLDFDRLLAPRLFRIPEYQRAYSWRQRQRKDLFSDIWRTQEQPDDRPHFMATIVGLRRSSIEIFGNGHHIIDITDGQQRITTLILLLKAIALKLDRSVSTEHRIGRDIDELLVKDDKATLLLLQTNHDSSSFFAEYIRSGKHQSSNIAETDSDRELLMAMEECEKFVDEWRNNGKSLEDLVTLLKNRLTFIFHEVSEESLVYTVFEVLNSRGLEVSWFDRLKSMLMEIVFESKSETSQEHIDDVHDLWKQMYRCVGLRRNLSTQSLRFAATLRSEKKPSKLMGAPAAARSLQRQSQNGPSDVIDTATWLKDVTKVLSGLVTDRRKIAVMEIVQARLLATAILLRDDFSDRERRNVIKKWEKVTFRIYGLFRRDARSDVGNYIRLAWEVANYKLSPDQVIDRLSCIGRRYPLDEVIKKLGESDCYSKWREELRYFMHRYEERLAEKSGQKFKNEQWNRIWEDSTAKSIEHICPQNNNEANTEQIHGLGNLLLLPPPLNSQLGNTPAIDKVDAYQKTGLLIAQEVANDITDAGEWTEEAMEKRKKHLLEWARNEWGD